MAIWSFFRSLPSFQFFIMSLLKKNTLLHYGTTSCSRIILQFLCPSPEINHFSRKFWLILLDNHGENKSSVKMCVKIFHKHVLSEVELWRQRGMNFLISLDIVKMLNIVVFQFLQKYINILFYSLNNA